MRSWAIYLQVFPLLLMVSHANLLGYYKFWNTFGNVLYDFSGIGNHAVVPSGSTPTWTDRGIYLDSSDSIQFPTNSQATFPSTDTSIVAFIWIYPISEGIIFKLLASNLGTDRYIAVKLSKNSSNITVHFMKDSTELSSQTTNFTFSQWRLFVVQCETKNSNIDVTVYMTTGNGQAESYTYSNYSFKGAGTTWYINSDIGGATAYYYESKWYKTVGNSVSNDFNIISNEGCTCSDTTTCNTNFSQLCRSAVADPLMNTQGEVCNCNGGSCYVNETCINSNCNWCSPYGCVTSAQICLSSYTASSTCVDGNSEFNSSLNSCVCKTGFTQYSTNPVACVLTQANCIAYNSSGCTQCNTGYFLNTSNSPKTCDQCLSNCQTCSNATTCSQCFNGYELSSLFTSCNPCSTGQFYDSSTKKCVSCISNCDICSVISTCSQCAMNYELSTDNTACNACSTGQYYDSASKRCLSCISNCNICLNGSTCSECIYGYTLSADYNSCNTCTDCLICPNNCLSCSSATICTQCATNYELSSDKTSCSLCSAYKYYDSSTSTCKDCKSNCKICSDATSCIECKSEFALSSDKESCNICASGTYYLSSTNPCQPCPINCNICSSTECIECAINYERSSDKKSCNQCSTGEYYNSTNNECTNCIPNCDICSDSNTCSMCAGNFALSSGNNACTTCPSGTYYLSSNTPCQLCMSNCISCSNSDSCIECAMNYELSTDNTSCIPCSTGEYYNSAFKECLACIPNCDICSDSTTCSQCATNYTLSSDSKSCISCPTGTYYNSISSTCRNCPANCNICTSTECVECSSGYILSSNKSSCECAPGYFQISDLNLCSPCSDNCILCTSSTICSICEDSFLFYSSGNSTACISECPDGYYNDSDITCEECMSNCAKCSSLSICEECRSGYHLYSHSEIVTCVDECPVGYYLSYSETSCDFCSISNCSSCIAEYDDIRCSWCEYGYYLINNECQKCDEGQYSDGITCSDCLQMCKSCSSNSTCTECIEGYKLNGDSCFQILSFDITYSSGVVMIQFDKVLTNELTVSDFRIKVNGVELEPSEYTLIPSEDNKTYKIQLNTLMKVNKIEIVFDESISGEDDSKLSELTDYITIDDSENDTDSNNDSESSSDSNTISQSEYLASDSVAADANSIGATASRAAVSGAVLFGITVPSGIWSFINTLQLMSLIPMMNIDIPIFLFGVLSGLRGYSPIPNILEHIIDKEGPQPYNRAVLMGYESSQFLLNCGDMITTLALTIILFPLLILIRKILSIKKRNSWIYRLVDRSILDYKWNVFTRFFVESYIEIGISAFMQIWVVGDESIYGSANLIINMILCIPILVISN